MRYTECRLAPLALELLTRSTKRPSTSNRTTTTPPSSRRCCRRVPQPAGQRLPGHRRGHGDQDPAPQPGRGDRRHRAPARPTRRDPRRPDGLREGPGLPDRRADPRSPGHPRRLPHRSRVDQDARRRRDRGGPQRRRIVVTEFPYETSVESIEEKIYDLVKNGELDGISAVPERLGRTQARWSSVQARRQRQRRAQQALQEHVAADHVRGQHAGPGRRRAAHPQPGPGADATTSRTRSRWSRGARSSACARPRPGPTSSRGSCKAIDMLDPSSRRSAVRTTARPRAAR
jgi:hypothetical protein